MEILYVKVFGLPLYKLIGWALSVLIIVLIARIIVRQANRSMGEKLIRKVVCNECGWVGSVTGRRPECPSCGSESLRPFRRE